MPHWRYTDLEINILFIIVIAALAIGAIWGAHRGLLESVIRIISCILGILVLVIIAKGIGSFIQGSFLSVVMAVILLTVIRIIHKVIKLILESLKLVRALPAGKLVDRLAGMALGLIEALIVIWVLFILIGSFNLHNLNAWINEQVSQSRFLSLIYDTNYIVMLLRQ